MTSTKRSISLVLLCLGALLLAAGQALGAPAKPAWDLSATALPTNLAPGQEGEILVVANNRGAASATGTITLTDVLPEGLSAFDTQTNDNDPASPDPSCEIALDEVTITCTSPGPIGSSLHLEVRIFVKAKSPQAEKTLINKASIGGGGALTASVEAAVTISSTAASFDFLPGFNAPLTEADGSVATLAGSHPYALSLNVGFPTERHPGTTLVAAGHVRDLSVDFPRGEVINPKATPVLCTEAELVTEVDPGCPPASQVGTVTAITVAAFVQAVSSPLYNMVPPPGQAAQLGFDALGVGFFVHVGGGVRNDGDYGLTGGSNDIPALTGNPVFGARVELWGDPTGAVHDEARHCLAKFSDPLQPCPVTETHTAFLATPGDCPGTPAVTRAHADSWEQPSPPSPIKETSYESTDLAGAPSSLQKCGELEFKPTITAKPTTNLTDSPSGLDVDLHQPQNFDPNARSTAILKDATLTLPAGVTVNPSQADGLAACNPAQIGLATAVGASPIHFTKPAAQCPNASKLGSVSVSTPLLGHSLPGALYIAKPFDNPFNSLLAVYLTVDDPQSGVVAKLAGEVHADPTSGQLAVTFKENPELPIEDVSVHLFTGPRASLRTPPACGSYESVAHLVPWSAPEGLPVNTGDSFASSAAPGGGTCPSSAAAAPNKPSFIAGTITPKAGSYSPFTLRFSRADGSQSIGGFEATLPQGLTAKLAGVPACSEAQIAAAKAREAPEKGVLEQASPSCPAASEIGTTTVAAGAGPTPLNVSGKVYLAGPYKGAPLSAVIITPAVAGPFDLGAVVVRAAIYLDRDTALVRTVSDPLPSILDGIPLDLRSATVRLGRPNFSLNPTSCDPKSVLATTTSLFGQPAALSSPFQVGGCKSLPYGPKLATRLFGPTHRGGHPRLRAVFTAKPGEANSARIVFALPHSEFIDQAHFRTICTRVQFAANQCPAGSVYGQVKAITPLLDYPLQGPIYLRSSNHKLPDVVVALRGPASQPIEIDLDGRVDSVNGGIRTSFESVPDAPATKVIVTLQGAKKGLFQNSTNICKGTHRASLKLTAQSGKLANSQPLLKADCPKAAKKKGKRAAKR